MTPTNTDHARRNAGAHRITRLHGNTRPPSPILSRSELRRLILDMVG